MNFFGFFVCLFWFTSCSVFNVTDQDGSKLHNREVIDHIQKVSMLYLLLISDVSTRRLTQLHLVAFQQQCLESDGYLVPPANGYALPEDQFTSIELTGADRPGLLSEVCAVLATLSCNIVKAEVWTHDGRTAAVIQVTDEATGRAVHDAGRLSRVQELLRDVMRGDGTCNHGGTGISAERRLHTLMLDSVGGGGAEEAGGGGDESGGCGVARPKVVVMDCAERRYTVVILRCRDRPKLLFDTLCALADLQYVVFHGTVDAEGASKDKEAYQVC
jgi:predicted amino acid-binding ACT domain protein